MALISTILIVLTALLHLGFLVLEMFLWTKPQGRSVFRMTAEQAEATRVLPRTKGFTTASSQPDFCGLSYSRMRHLPSS